MGQGLHRGRSKQPASQGKLRNVEGNRNFKTRKMTAPKALIVTALLVLALCLSGPAFAREPAVVISTVEGSIDAETGRAIMREAYRRIGMETEFRAFSAHEALEMANSGAVHAELERIDGISNRYENLVKVPIPINVIYGVAFSRKYKFPVNGWHSLRPYQIGIVKGILFAEENTRNMEVQVAADYPELMAMLSDGRVDVAVLPRVQALEFIRRNGESNIVEMEGILETIFLYHYVHNSRTDLVVRLRPVLKEMLQSGETRRIRDVSLSSREIVE